MLARLPKYVRFCMVNLRNRIERLERLRREPARPDWLIVHLGDDRREIFSLRGLRPASGGLCVTLGASDELESAMARFVST